MGGNQSTRKLTIANEEEVGVIKVSNAVIHRLANQGEESAEDQPTKTVSPPPPNISSLPSKTADVPSFPVYYHPEFTLSALEIQQQKERELQNQDRYWQNRLHNLEKNHQKVDRLLEEEFEKAIKEMSSKGKRTHFPEGSSQPCTDKSEKVLKCYQENPRESLKCSSLVEEFSKCVDQCRSRVIAAQC